MWFAARHALLLAERSGPVHTWIMVSERGIGPTIETVPEGDDRIRLVCPDCGYIAYENPKVVVGAVCGTATAVMIAFSGPIFGMDPHTGVDPISFMWIGPTALLVNLASGSLVSLGLQRKKPT